MTRLLIINAADICLRFEKISFSSLPVKRHTAGRLLYALAHCHTGTAVGHQELFSVRAVFTARRARHASPGQKQRSRAAAARLACACACACASPRLAAASRARVGRRYRLPREFELGAKSSRLEPRTVQSPLLRFLQRQPGAAPDPK